MVAANNSVDSTANEARLKFHFEGATPGLRGQCLSLFAFGPSLNNLWKGLQQTAWQIMNEAPDGLKDEQREDKQKEGELLEIEIESFVAGCIVMRVTVNALATNRLFNRLPKETLVRWLNLLEQENRGVQESAVAREYLTNLPEGVFAQDYEVLHKGESLKQVRIRVPDRVLGEKPMPGLIHIKGVIVGIGFEPGKPTIVLKPSLAPAMTLSASEEQVEQALALRGCELSALAVLNGEIARLLWICLVGEEPTRSFKLAKERVFDRWHEVLRRLSQ